MNTIWRLLDTGKNNPYINMAIDEALAINLDKDGVPILRFYDWTEPAISIGYSQKVNDVLNLELCRKDSIPFVRRITGGGVVFHGMSFTYSIIIPKSYVLSIKDTYLWIQNNIKNGLNSLGMKGSIFNKINENKSDYCFTSPNISDLMIENKKVSGIAGRRIKRNLVCQGYVYCNDAKSMLKYVKKLHSLDNAICLNDINNGKININVFKNSIIGKWPVKFIEQPIDNQEDEILNKIYIDRYSQDSWNTKR